MEKVAKTELLLLFDEGVVTLERVFATDMARGFDRKTAIFVNSLTPSRLLFKRSSYSSVQKALSSSSSNSNSSSSHKESTAFCIFSKEGKSADGPSTSAAAVLVSVNAA